MVREGGSVVGKPSPQRQADWPPQTQGGRACSPDPTPADGTHRGTEGIRHSERLLRPGAARQSGEGRERAQGGECPGKATPQDVPGQMQQKEFCGHQSVPCFQSLSAENR